MRYLQGYRWRRLLILSISCLALGYFCGAEEPQSDKAGSEAATAQPASDQARAADAPAAPDLPPYMTATSPDPKAPLDSERGLRHWCCLIRRQRMTSIGAIQSGAPQLIDP